MHPYRFIQKGIKDFQHPNVDKWSVALPSVAEPMILNMDTLYMHEMYPCVHKNSYPLVRSIRPEGKKISLSPFSKAGPKVKV